MNVRKHFLEAATLIIAAIICAVVANAFASRDRKVALVGTYTNALTVPAPAPDAAPPPVGTTIVDSTAPPPVTTSVTTTAATATAAPLTTTTQVPVVPPAVSTATTSLSRAAVIPPSPSPITSAAPTTPASARPDLSKYVPHPDKAYIEFAYADVAALHAGGALFLDARRTNIYEQGHIAGARPFAVWESDVEDKVRALWEQRQDPKEQALPIVVYCSGGDCEDSHMLAQKLWGAQFNNVYVYKDGFPDWQAHQGAVHTGANP